jgi:predicted CDP-diglyceride synthetase/phosphatidate cytidylyltransferase
MDITITMRMTITGMNMDMDTDMVITMETEIMTVIKEIAIATHRHLVAEIIKDTETMINTHKGLLEGVDRDQFSPPFNLCQIQPLYRQLGPR